MHFAIPLQPGSGMRTCNECLASLMSKVLRSLPEATNYLLHHTHHTTTTHRYAYLCQLFTECRTTTEILNLQLDLPATALVPREEGLGESEALGTWGGVLPNCS
jgi:hypothetical protein